jgi:hypothetical protein
LQFKKRLPKRRGKEKKKEEEDSLETGLDRKK